MRPSTAWSFAVARLLGLLAMAVAGGLVFGYLAVWVTAVLAGALVVHFTHLWRLERWLRKRRTEAPPDFTGVWGDIVALITRIYRRKQFHKRRIVELFREFRRMTTAMPDGVIVLNASREILWFNRPAARLLALRRKVDFGLRIENLLRHPSFVRYLDARDYLAPIVLNSPVAAESFLSLHVVAYGSGQQLLLVRDVSRAVRIEAMRKDFVANASHELRSPITVISGYLDALAEEGALDPTWAGPIAEMRRQAERMRAVVNDLIELSRIEASDSEAATDLVDVAGMLSLMRKEVLALARRPKEVRLQLDTDAKLLGVEAELHSVFWNLISNAVKYTPVDGLIDIRWWLDADGVHFAVRDSGIGIPAAHLPRITERFYRVDAGRSRATGGSGLGLAIVKHALSRHGATLEIASEEGRGSTFSCHFPLRRVALAERAAATA